MTTIERLAAALHASRHVVSIIPSPSWKDSSSGRECYGPKRDCIKYDTRQAAAILAADGQLAADIELGAAWREAEEALPEGSYIRSLILLGHIWEVAIAKTNRAGIRVWHGPTPTAALIALRDALLERGTK